jgi:hypothetical protein
MMRFLQWSEYIVAEMKHCGKSRRLGAFLYPDWFSATRRYEYDIRQLVEGVKHGRLEEPGDASTASRQSPERRTNVPTVKPPITGDKTAPESEFGAGILDG